MSNELKDLKKALRLFRQARRNKEAGTDERKELTGKIRELEVQISNLRGEANTSDKKKDLIAKLHEIDSTMKMINLYKFSEEELEFSLLKKQGLVVNKEDYYKNHLKKDMPSKTVVVQEPIVGSSEENQVKSIGISNAQAIANELLAGHTRQEIIDNVNKLTGAKASGIKSQIDGILKKIKNKDGKWSGYADVSGTDGILKIEKVK